MNQSLSYEIAQVMPAAIDSGLFVSLTTITKPPTAQGPTGNPTGPYVPVSSDLTDIQCMDAPESVSIKISADETKAEAQILSKGMRHVLLSRCFIASKTWAGLGYRAVVDGVEYDLLGAENDSQDTQTRIDLQKASV
jgi:hypothetical protein